MEDLGLFLAACLVVFMMFLGCGYPIDQERVVAAPPGASEATQAILTSYRSNGRDMPPVTWYSPEASGPCVGTFTNPKGDCASGLQWGGFGSWHSGHIIVEVFPDLRITWDVLAHEIAHWRFDVDGHPAYVFGDYLTTGVDGAVVAKAVEAVDKAGGAQ